MADMDQPAAGGENTDPVCGMPVSADAGYAKMYQGKFYRFCSRTYRDNSTSIRGGT